MVVGRDGPEAESLGGRRDRDQPFEPGRLVVLPTDLRKMDTELHARTVPRDAPAREHGLGGEHRAHHLDEFVA